MQGGGGGGGGEKDDNHQHHRHGDTMRQRETIMGDHMVNVVPQIMVDMRLKTGAQQMLWGWYWYNVRTEAGTINLNTRVNLEKERDIYYVFNKYEIYIWNVIKTCSISYTKTCSRYKMNCDVCASQSISARQHWLDSSHNNTTLNGRQWVKWRRDVNEIRGRGPLGLRRSWDGDVNIYTSPVGSSVIHVTTFFPQ